VVDGRTGSFGDVRISPRYDGKPIIDVDAIIENPGEAVIRQRDRFAIALRELTPAEWQAQSRCSEWTVQDVIAHLVGVNRYFNFALSAGARGEPTRVLAEFDPVAVPAQMVDAARGTPYGETLDEFIESNGELAAIISAFSAADWSKVGEAPPGHIALRAVAAHALWDSWTHERDVLLPLGRKQIIEDDELVTSLAYVVAINPTLRVSAGAAKAASLNVIGHDPEISLTAAVGSEVVVRPGLAENATVTLEGEAVDLVEGLTCRVPAPEVAAEHRWLITGLAEAFDVPA
jgi:uncharacterized protein (TIGR03083 family)